MRYTSKDGRPDRGGLEHLISLLEDPVEDLVRNDSFFKKLELDHDALVGDSEAVIELLLAHPRLLQRPVLMSADSAIIGRPRDRVPAFIGALA
ncbi:MAG: arsenate reductase family protein [Acidimicrobiales bacterium]